MLIAWDKRSDDESIYDSWSDDDDDGGNLKDSTTEKPTNVIRNGQPSMAQIHCNLKKVVEAGNYINFYEQF